MDLGDSLAEGKLGHRQEKRKISNNPVKYFKEKRSNDNPGSAWKSENTRLEGQDPETPEIS